MKKIIIFYLMVFLLGCSYGTEKIKSIVDDPAAFLEDPHYAGYQEKSDDLERSYLQKNISYAEYVEQKKQLDENYAKEVQQREKAIEDFR